MLLYQWLGLEQPKTKKEIDMSHSSKGLARVCLIIPPSAFLLDERVFMSLGVLKVAAVLEAACIPVEVLDLSGVSNYLEAVSVHASITEARVFGLTATTPQLPSARAIAETLKKVRSDSRVIIGGPHVTLVSAACKRECKRGVLGRAHQAMRRLEELFDVLVAGDGEEAIFPAIREGAPKLLDADDPSGVLWVPEARLEHLPFPARHLVDVASYRYSIEGIPALSLIAQLGCPFECGFCGGRASAMLRRIRTRPTESIVREMRQMYEAYGRQGFMLYDDELNVSREMVQLMRQIALTQRELGVEWRLRGFVKAELFNQEQAEALAEAGFKQILVGFESGSPRILANINKKATREDNTRAVQIAHAAGLKVKALMSIGHPGESSETVKDTLDWLLSTRPDDLDVTVITCYPGTPYYDEAEEVGDGTWVYTFKRTGDRLYQDNPNFDEHAEYYKGKPGEYHAFVFTDELSRKQLVIERDRLEATVRAELSIPFYAGVPGVQFEHSMGQSGLPPSILRSSVS